MSRRRDRIKELEKALVLAEEARDRAEERSKQCLHELRADMREARRESREEDLARVYWWAEKLITAAQPLADPSAHSNSYLLWHRCAAAFRRGEIGHPSGTLELAPVTELEGGIPMTSYEIQQRESQYEYFRDVNPFLPDN